MTLETTTQLNESTLKGLRDLVQINIDSAKGFDDAADRLEDPQLTGLFRSLASERQAQAETLTGYVELNEDEAPDDGSVAAALHRSWLKVRDMVSNQDNAAVLAEAERGEDKIKAEYEKVLKDTAGSAVNDVLQRQYAAVKSAHDKVRDLRDAFQAKS